MRRAWNIFFVPESKQVLKNVGNMFKGLRSRLEGLPLAESGTVDYKPLNKKRIHEPILILKI